MQYVGRHPIITNTTLTNANTWYLITSAIPGVRQWMLKPRESTDNEFDYDLTNATSPTHSTFMTNSGVGIAFDKAELPAVYCRSETPGTVIELLYFN